MRRIGNIRALVFALTIVLIGSAFGSISHGAPGAASGKQESIGRVVFDISYPYADTVNKIATIRADGSGFQVLAPGVWGNYPDLSPDGSEIAFLGEHGISVMSVDGTNVRPLGPMYVGPPVWSADGKRIAFYGQLPVDWNLYLGTTPPPEAERRWRIMDADGSNITALDIGPKGFKHSLQLSWSPDGSKVAFAALDEGSQSVEIWVANVDGSDPVRLTDNGAVAGGPVWSPDGSRIAFASHRGNTAGIIWTMNSDGTDQRRLVPHRRCDQPPSLFPPASPGVDYPEFCPQEMSPAWSPDGTEITFVAFRGSGSKIVIVDRDGTNERTVFEPADGVSFVDWGPASFPAAPDVAPSVEPTPCVTNPATGPPPSTLTLITTPEVDLRTATPGPSTADPSLVTPPTAPSPSGDYGATVTPPPSVPFESASPAPAVEITNAPEVTPSIPSPREDVTPTATAAVIQTPCAESNGGTESGGEGSEVSVRTEWLIGAGALAAGALSFAAVRFGRRRA